MARLTSSLTGANTVTAARIRIRDDATATYIEVPIPSASATIELVMPDRVIPLHPARTLWRGLGNAGLGLLVVIAALLWYYITTLPVRG